VIDACPVYDFEGAAPAWRSDLVPLDAESAYLSYNFIALLDWGALAEINAERDGVPDGVAASHIIWVAEHLPDISSYLRCGQYPTVESLGRAHQLAHCLRIQASGNTHVRFAEGAISFSHGN